MKRPDPGHCGGFTIGDITTAAYNVGVSHGAAVAFGLMGMAEAIRRRTPELDRYIEPVFGPATPHLGEGDR